MVEKEVKLTQEEAASLLGVSKDALKTWDEFPKLVPVSAINECKELLQSSLPEESEMHLTIDQAAFLLGVSKQTLRNWEASGKLVPAQRTDGGHRRYTKSQVNSAKKEQLGCSEFIIPKITPERIFELVNSLFASFDSYEPVNISFRNQTSLNNKVVITVESYDGLSSVSKSFSVEGSTEGHNSDKGENSETTL